MINDNYVPLNQLGNGVTTVFSAAWNMLAASYARVYFEDTTTGVQTLQPTGWSIVISDAGWIVTFAVAPPSTVRVIIGREVALDQATPFRTSRGWQGGTVENAFDKITGMVQDVQEQVARALVFPLGDTSSPVLQSAALRANKTFIFDSLGNASAGSVTGTTVSAPMIPVVGAASLASALSLLGALSSAAGSVANANLATMAANTVKANATAGVASPTDVALAASQLLGRGASGNIAPITMGVGMSMVGTALTATAGGTVLAVQVFTGSGTYTPTAGMDYCTIEVVGGGASGTYTAGGGAGGSAGGYARKTVAAATIGASQSVTVGAGGAAATAGSQDGKAGGTTSVGAIVSASGGAGITSGKEPGDAGTGSSGDINMRGGMGDATDGAGSTTTTVCGAGGNSVFGGGGKARIFSTASSVAGQSGHTNSGGGGAGNYSNSGSSSSGAGGAGIVIITEFI